jgi:hypothetical protein
MPSPAAYYRHYRKHNHTGRRCPCGRPMIACKASVPICQHCLEIENSKWWHNNMEGMPEPVLGEMEPFKIHCNIENL